MKTLLLIAFTTLFSGSFAQNQKLSKRDLKVLLSYMQGNFSSYTQSKNDSAFFHIVLHMHPIWENDKQGFWLYVEQAMATVQEKPYRQRVYYLSLLNDTSIESKVYEIKNALRYAGAWQKLELIKALSKDSLILRTGCSIILHQKEKNSFYGSTLNKECSSNLRGAIYATSEVVIDQEKMISWDRGWNTENKQVWGAVKSGYIFEKEKNKKQK